MAAHSWVAQNVSKVPPAVIEAIRTGKPIGDPRLAALKRFTGSMVQKRGNPTHQDAQQFLEAGFTEANILEIILAVAVKTLSNYSNHIFHTPVDDAFAACAWTPRQDSDTSHGNARSCATEQHR